MPTTITNNNGWTKELLKNLKILKAKAWRDTWLHQENAGYLGNAYDWESGFAFCASFFSGIIQIFRSSLIYVQIVAILLNFISSFLQFHIKFKNYPSLIEKHKIATSRFSRIYNQINGQESMDLSRRQRGNDFFTWISSGYETLHVTAPEVDDVVRDTYHRKFKNAKAYKIIENDEFDISSGGASQLQSASGITDSSANSSSNASIKDDNQNHRGGNDQIPSNQSDTGSSSNTRRPYHSSQIQPLNQLSGSDDESRSHEYTSKQFRGNRFTDRETSTRAHSEPTQVKTSMMDIKLEKETVTDDSKTDFKGPPSSDQIIIEIRDEPTIFKSVNGTFIDTRLKSLKKQKTTTTENLPLTSVQMRASQEESQKSPLKVTGNQSAPNVLNITQPTGKYDPGRYKYEMNRMDMNLNGLQEMTNLYSMDHRCMIDDSEMRNPVFKDDPLMITNSNSRINFQRSKKRRDRKK